MKNFKKNAEVQKRAQKVLPLGVNSNFRYWGEGITPYVKKAKGSHLWDVDGNEYIDYRMAFGPIILGHAYEAVDSKVIEEVKNGVLFAMTGELELDVAEMIVEMCPGVDMVRMACSGTEATMHAIRVARAYTGREIILKFEGDGDYNGASAYLEANGKIRETLQSDLERLKTANIPLDIVYDQGTAVLGLTK